MIDIKVTATGSLNFPEGKEIAGAIRRGMTAVAFDVANLATLHADGRPGPIVRTGRLRASITGRVSPDGFSAVIGTNVEYAPRLEMGFSGTERVKAHTRTITQAFGRPIAPRRVDVGPFERQANHPAYPFLRPGVEDAQRKGIIERDIQREIDKVT